MNIYTHILNRDVYSGQNELYAYKGERVKIEKVFADICIVQDTKGKQFDVRREYLTLNDQKMLTDESTD